MKNMIKTVPGKATLFLLCVIAAAVTVVSTLSAVFIIQADLYYTPKDEIIESEFISIAFSRSEGIINEYLQFTGHKEDETIPNQAEVSAEEPKANPEKDGRQNSESLNLSAVVLPEKGNLIFEITDHKGRTLAKSEFSEESSQWIWAVTFSKAQMKTVDSFYLKGIQPSEYETLFSKKSEHGGESPRDYIIKYSWRPGFPASDRLSLFVRIVELAYAVRYSIFWIIAASGLLTVASFLALMYASGRRAHSEEIHPGPLSAVPFDLLIAATACAVYFIGILFFQAMQAGGRSGTLPWQLIPLLYFGILLLSLGLGLCMSAAGRIKQKTLIKNTLLFRFLALIRSCALTILRLIGRTVRAFVLSFSEIGTVKKVFIVFSGAFFLELILLLISRDSFASILFFWFLRSLAIFPIALNISLQMRRLQAAGLALAEGDLQHHTDTSKLFGALRSHGENMNSIAAGMSKAVAERLKSERMKTELITNVSHDIKTPLTSIINYTSILSKSFEELQADEQSYSGRTEDIRSCVEVLEKQSDRLKNLIDDLVEASKASTGNIELIMTPSDAGLYMTQISGEYADKLQQSGLTPVLSAPETDDKLLIMADSRRMWRIFDNIMNNICKYSLTGTRVYLDLKADRSEVAFTFKNTSRDKLNLSAEELLERFTRGDRSRNSEGSGLGLSIASSLAELQGGSLHIATDGDLFKLTLRFPRLSS